MTTNLSTDIDRKARSVSIPTRRWGEAQALFLVLFALLGAALVSALALNPKESTQWITFLQGQSEWSGLGVLFGASLFWKVLGGSVAGALVGDLLCREIPTAGLQRARLWARGGLIFLLSVMIYIPSMSAGFIWDDDQEITANPSLRTTYGLWEIWTGGLSNPPLPDAPVSEAEKNSTLMRWMGMAAREIQPRLKWIENKIFDEVEGRRAHESADYFPLKTTMLWLEFQIWGTSPYGYHVVNILVHAVDALLLWLVLSQLRVPGAWLGALLFAIHPVHVESVSWIAERKNTLSLFFYLLSASAFIQFDKTNSRRMYFFALLAFIGSLLCKTSVVMLPPAFILYLWWKYGDEDLPKLFRKSLSVVPFFAIAGFLALVTIYFQNGRAIGQEVIPIGDFWSRLAGAGLASWWYLEKAILPINLTTIYPRFPIDPPQAMQFVAGFLMVALLVILFVARKRIGRTPFFVLAYFMTLLFPVLGFFRMSYMRLTLVADHFQYLSDISIVAAAGALIYLAWQKAGSLRPLVTGATVLLIVVFSVYSWVRAGVHLGERTLWTDALKYNEASWQAHNHIGAVVYGDKNYDQAAIHFARAVELKPENPEVHNNLGLIYAQRGQMDKAISEYRRAVEIKGDVPAMRRNLADALSMTKQFHQAKEQYKVLLETAPGDPNLRVAYGYVLHELGEYRDARAQFMKALEIAPGLEQAAKNIDAMNRAGR